ncbi:unnamed protein product [Bursaphelenchus okinawaensis]|uniref:Ig-like domain-containing protein n=1 Tax=Bursaphelenchus okinawaensis TaxID=465554 RepID=A0A811L9C0_9BILA|nr:unnamed protein product [Bursaphelenchus okinawaensis]CAG9119675.1 unnamed protein product [Bursaphelenchus okinawaensis]
MADPVDDKSQATESVTEDSSSLSRIVEVRLPDSNDESDDQVRRPFSASPIGSSRRSPYFMIHSPVSAYETNQERTLQRTDSASTISETHLLHKEGAQDNFFTEEHWSSEIKSFVTSSPPKFAQVLKAYRVLATDRLTFVVEVSSDPPAIFDWFCNDQSVSIDRRRFTVRHAVNATTLTVDGPEQGVYSCSARNPAGVSKTYGFVTVADPTAHRESLLDFASSDEAARVFKEKLHNQTSEQQATLRKPPKFTNQIPNLTLKPGNEAIIDVEVDSQSWTKFMWYVNGKLVQPDNSNVEFFSPKPNRCVALFKIPFSGEYSVVAQNEAGIAKSSGYVEISKDATMVPHSHLLRSRGKAALPGGSSPRRSASITKTTVHSVTYVSRCNSLPRNEPIDETPEARLSRQSMTPEKTGPQMGISVYAPKFVPELPSQLFQAKDEKMVITAHVLAQPTAEFYWNYNGKPAINSDTVKVTHEDNQSTLTIEPPVLFGTFDVIATNVAGSAMNQIIVYDKESEEAKLLAKADRPKVVENITTLVRTDVQREAIISHSDEDSDDTFVIYTADEEDVQDGVVRESETIKTSQNVLIPPNVMYPQKPVFIEMPASQLISLEADEKFEAKVQLQAHPPALVRWYFKNVELKQDENIEIIDSEPNTSTIIHSKPQSGLYRAVAMNEHGMTALELRVFASDIDAGTVPTIQAPTESEVTKPVVIAQKSIEQIKEETPRPPTITRPLLPNYILKQQPLILETEVDSSPMPTFQWKYNNSDLADDGDKIKVERTNTVAKITIKDAEEGRYEVVALNDHGKCVSSTKVVLEAEEPLLFVNTLPKLTVSNGILRVKVNSPNGAFKWYENGQEVTEGEDFHIEYGSDSSTLTILKPRKGATLTATYTLGTNQITTETKIEDEEESEDKTKEMKPLEDQETTNINKEEEKYNLLVKVAESLAESLVANIILQAVQETTLRISLNNSKNKLQDGHFNVAESDELAPQFVMKNERFKVSEGETLTIHESLTGAPCSNVIWLRNGVEIFDEDRVEKITTEGHVQLVIHNVILDDYGEYRCRVENDYGCAEFIGKVSDGDEGDLEEPEEISQKALNVDIKDGTLQQIIECIIADIPHVQSAFTIGRSIETTAVVNLKVKGKGVTEDPATSHDIVEKREKRHNIPSIVVEAHQDEEPKIEEREVTDVQVETHDDEEDFEIVDAPQIVEGSSEEQLSSGSEVTLAPRFQQALLNISCRESKTLQLKCIVTGVPMPNIEWFFNGEPLSTNANQTIEFEDGVALLRIRNASADNEGQYTCTATNSVGAESTAGFVKITG